MGTLSIALEGKIWLLLLPTMHLALFYWLFWVGICHVPVPTLAPASAYGYKVGSPTRSVPQKVLPRATHPLPSHPLYSARAPILGKWETYTGISSLDHVTQQYL